MILSVGSYFFIKIFEVECRIKIYYFNHKANGIWHKTKIIGLNSMESSEKYLRDLKQWLQDTADSPMEEMSDFFTKLLDDYE